MVKAHELQERLQAIEKSPEPSVKEVISVLKEALNAIGELQEEVKRMEYKALQSQVAQR
jgi:predicted protein tyrosine phosphatase